MEMELEEDGSKEKTMKKSIEGGLKWSEWQLLDSILPTGGFAHSLGVEATMQSNLISNQQDLHHFIIHLLENTASLLLPFVRAAASSPDTATLRRLDCTLHATLSNEVARRASAAQGSALMRVAAAMFADDASAPIKEMRRLGGGVSFHHAVVFGLVCGLLGMDSATAQRAYVFVTMRDAVSAATRLNLVGPLGAAVMQHRIAGAAERIVVKWMDRGVDEACQVAPLLDTVQGCHSYLFSRLFCS